MTSKARVTLEPLRAPEPDLARMHELTTAPRPCFTGGGRSRAPESFPGRDAAPLRAPEPDPARMHELTTAPRPSQVAIQLRFEQAADDYEQLGSGDGAAGGAQSTEQPVAIEDAYAGSGGLEVL